jgi:hypothetical protein
VDKIASIVDRISDSEDRIAGFLLHVRASYTFPGSNRAKQRGWGALKELLGPDMQRRTASAYSEFLVRCWGEDAPLALFLRLLSIRPPLQELFSLIDQLITRGPSRYFHILGDYFGVIKELYYSAPNRAEVICIFKLALRLKLADPELERIAVQVISMPRVFSTATFVEYLVRVARTDAALMTTLDWLTGHSEEDGTSFVVACLVRDFSDHPTAVEGSCRWLLGQGGIEAHRL